MAEGVEMQFGFKSGLSGSHVFCFFVDFSKAFDHVNYWQLFRYLINDDVNSKLVRLLSYWYSQQLMCVHWHNKTSDSFSVSNGTRQGSTVFCHLFCLPDIYVIC